MAVNAILLPFAYFKTLLHKLLLLIRYKSASHCENLVIFIFLGLPFLVFAQITDAIRFMAHSYEED